MKRTIIITLISVLTAGWLHADEGMWLLPLLEKLNIKTMQNMGCRLSADDIYSINQSSLKDAIVIFGGGCTAEMVSDQGLLLTNHHCGYDAIQQHSTVEHDYLADGFWAKTKSDEIPTPDLSVTFLVRIDDVTNRINAAITSSRITEEERQNTIDSISAQIIAEATAGTHHIGEVESYFGGNQFYLAIYEVYTDIRMVGAPPSSIGKFGDETDNWVWPRHTGDFSIFRVYAGPDGKPASYAPENIPLKPRHFLPISLKGAQKGDYAMIMGYPGSTDRYMTSAGIEELLQIDLPTRVKIRGEKQEIMKRHMHADHSVRIKYATKYAQSSNYWKYSIGQIEGIKRLSVIQRKQKEEQQFNTWLNADPQRKNRYGDPLKQITEATHANRNLMLTADYYSECLLQGMELPRFAIRFTTLNRLLANNKADADSIALLTTIAQITAAEFYKDYNAALDHEVTTAMMKRFFADLPPEASPDLHQAIAKKYKGNIDKYIDHWFRASIFADSTRLHAFLRKPSAKALRNDPVFQAGQAIRLAYNNIIDPLLANYDQIERGYRSYIAGILDMDRSKAWYPDANFTMRLTYGRVDDYPPRDGVHYKHYTTLQGVIEKEDPGNPEFIVPARLKQLYADRNFGRYADRNGQMPVCFISDNDITGGNSGSPVINGNGELIGIAFDGNWEAMSGDIVFEPAVQRTISVDIRYVLFIIDKYAGATHLINEMTIR